MKNLITKQITKHMIAQHIHDNMGLAKSVTEKLILQLFHEIIAILQNGGNIKLPNFGSFNVYSKNARPGMNMHTNQKITISHRQVIRFIPSRILKNRVNSAKKEILYN